MAGVKGLSIMTDRDTITLEGGDMLTVEVPEAEAAPVRYFIFCPKEPEKMVVLNGGRVVTFRNGRLDSVNDKLRPQDVDYFRQRMQQKLDLHQQPEYIVWDGPVTDPLLQSILSPLVAEAIAHGATAVGGNDDLKMTQIRLSMMLVDDSGDVNLISVDQQTRLRLAEIANKPVRTALGALPDQFAPAPTFAPPPMVTSETLEREQAVINAAVNGQTTQAQPAAAEPGSAWQQPANPFGAPAGK